MQKELPMLEDQILLEDQAILEQETMEPLARQWPTQPPIKAAKHTFQVDQVRTDKNTPIPTQAEEQQETTKKAKGSPTPATTWATTDKNTEDDLQPHHYSKIYLW